jgi:hypothetical protein
MREAGLDEDDGGQEHVADDDLQYSEGEIRPRPFTKLSTSGRTPSESAVITEPDPPVRSVPPTATNAIVSDSQPTPSMGWPAPNREAKTAPDNQASSPPQKIANDLDPFSLQAHASGDIVSGDCKSTD